MLTDMQLPIFANMLGVSLFLLVVLYHYTAVNNPKKQEGKWHFLCPQVPGHSLKQDGGWSPECGEGCPLLLSSSCLMDVGYNGRASAAIVAMRAVPRTGAEVLANESLVSAFPSFLATFTTLSDGSYTIVETLSPVAFHFLGASAPRDPSYEAVVLFPVEAKHIKGSEKSCKKVPVVVEVHASQVDETRGSAVCLRDPKGAGDHVSLLLLKVMTHLSPCQQQVVRSPSQEHGGSAADCGWACHGEQGGAGWEVPV
ncbi:PREDICTED: uncharacterized protein LOC105001868 [Bison bison bison]|uniref:Dolichyl-diphosphooligosaccharide--protein glycosyltransferase subunit 4 n=1 Tax=Bison bison bison TaxID=43346 RepID=A0A6P3IZV0_BISBB|nr:PREDICTED: uncharacterized protein LOC105001868 [Bison bison bison]